MDRQTEKIWITAALGSVIFTALLFVCGIYTGVVLSGSMTPAIPAGSIIYSVKCDSPETGDTVITDDRVMHRVTETKGVMVRTKGDANRYADRGWHKAERKVVFCQRYGMLPVAVFLLMPLISEATERDRRFR